MIDAGSLIHRVTIYAPVPARSATGAETSSWSALATVWAARERLSLSEVNRMAGRAEAADAKFVLRYRADLETNMEVSCDGRRFCVVGVEEMGNREGIALLARAV